MSKTEELPDGVEEMIHERVCNLAQAEYHFPLFDIEYSVSDGACAEMAFSSALDKFHDDTEEMDAHVDDVSFDESLGTVMVTAYVDAPGNDRQTTWSEDVFGAAEAAWQVVGRDEHPPWKET